MLCYIEDRFDSVYVGNPRTCKIVGNRSPIFGLINKMVALFRRDSYGQRKLRLRSGLDRRVDS
jgi:hypothetical protein